MTIKERIAAVRALGLTCSWKGATQEYRVNFKGGTEATAYYTNDAEDALHTAEAMMRREAILSPHFSVLVSNIGIITQAPNRQTADAIYADYCILSRLAVGRCSGQNVTIINELGDIFARYIGTIDTKADRREAEAQDREDRDSLEARRRQPAAIVEAYRESQPTHPACPRCAGSGSITVNHYEQNGTHAPYLDECPDCFGTGKPDIPDCEDCNGSGARKTDLGFIVACVTCRGTGASR